LIRGVMILRIEIDEYCCSCFSVSLSYEPKIQQKIVGN
jgi:hypothetical protein